VIEPFDMFQQNWVASAEELILLQHAFFYLPIKKLTGRKNNQQQLNHCQEYSATGSNFDSSIR
jgi:hypothetical protein